MEEKFIVGKRYKFNPMKFMLECGVDALYNYTWIDEIKDLVFKVEQELLHDEGTSYETIFGYDLNVNWCIEMDSDIHYLTLIEDTYGSSVVLYEENGKFKTKHIKLFEEMLTNQLTYK